VCPNPFTPTVEIRCEIGGIQADSAPLALRIYDVQGKCITGLAERVPSPEGVRFSWDGRHPDGRPAPSGVYFVEVLAGESREIRKVVLAR
jgi:hypothetical protein